eukprot:1161689-Pelagomonas_calceolata.AAC.4
MLNPLPEGTQSRALGGLRVLEFLKTPGSIEACIGFSYVCLSWSVQSLGDIKATRATHKQNK